MSNTTHTTHRTGGAAAAPQARSNAKPLIFLGLVIAAFMLSYGYALATSGGYARGTGSAGAQVGPGQSVSAGGGLSAAAPAGGGCGMSAGSGGGGCCGGGGPAVEGATTVAGGVQTIAVDTSAGSFNPNVIKAKAGVPIELEFSQAPGGCLSGVFFPDFNVNEDLTAGSKTVKLPALENGEYSFYCQMQMVSAKIIVE